MQLHRSNALAQWMVKVIITATPGDSVQTDICTTDATDVCTVVMIRAHAWPLLQEILQSYIASRRALPQSLLHAGALRPRLWTTPSSDT